MMKTLLVTFLCFAFSITAHATVLTNDPGPYYGVSYNSSAGNVKSYLSYSASIYTSITVSYDAAVEVVGSPSYTPGTYPYSMQIVVRSGLGGTYSTTTVPIQSGGSATVFVPYNQSFDLGIWVTSGQPTSYSNYYRVRVENILVVR